MTTNLSEKEFDELKKILREAPIAISYIFGDRNPYPHNAIYEKHQAGYNYEFSNTKYASEEEEKMNLIADFLKNEEEMENVIKKTSKYDK